jgi:hypothetical protein
MRICTETPLLALEGKFQGVACALPVNRLYDVESLEQHVSAVDFSVPAMGEDRIAHSLRMNMAMQTIAATVIATRNEGRSSREEGDERAPKIAPNAMHMRHFHFSDLDS